MATSLHSVCTALLPYLVRFKDLGSQSGRPSFPLLILAAQQWGPRAGQRMAMKLLQSCELVAMLGLLALLACCLAARPAHAQANAANPVRGYRRIPRVCDMIAIYVALRTATCCRAHQHSAAAGQTVLVD